MCLPRTVSFPQLPPVSLNSLLSTITRIAIPRYRLTCVCCASSCWNCDDGFGESWTSRLTFSSTFVEVEYYAWVVHLIVWKIDLWRLLCTIIYFTLNIHMSEQNKLIQNRIRIRIELANSSKRYLCFVEISQWFISHILFFPLLAIYI